MELIVDPNGTARCIYGEEINLAALGSLAISRASHVEPTVDGQWVADLAPVFGPVLGPFDQRSHALEAERDWLERHVVIRENRLYFAHRVARNQTGRMMPGHISQMCDQVIVAMRCPRSSLASLDRCGSPPVHVP